MSPFVAVSLLAVLYVVVPSFLIVYADSRGWKFIACPEEQKLAQIRFKAGRVAASSLFGNGAVRDVRDCSFWPVRAGCAQRCTARA